MRKLFYLILLFGCSRTNQVNGQNLVGVWQKDSKEFGSASLDCYHFFNDGKFIYYFDGYDEANRTLAIKGIYQVKGDGRIIFKIVSSIEIEGGTYSKRGSTEHNGWAIIEHKGVKEIKQNSKEVVSSIEKCLDGDDKTPCFIIDDDKFFKIKDTPEDLFKK